MDGDKPLQTKGLRLRIVFTHMVEEPDAGTQPYLANTLPDGSFVVPGRRGKGIPVGKYNISVQLLKGGSGPHGEDQLKGKFGPGDSPITREFTSNETLTIDVSKPGG